MKYLKPIIIVIAIIVVFLFSAWGYNEFQKNASLSDADSDTNSDDDSDSDADSDTKSDNDSDEDPDKGIDVGDLAYDFTLETFDGDSVTLSSLRGKVIVLNFWASWCGPCQDEMPDFQDLYEDILADGDRADTVIVSINMTDGGYETRDTAMSFLSNNGYTFPVLSDSGEVASLYDVTSIPRTFILNKDGVITEVIFGSTILQDLYAAIENAR